MKLGTLKSKNRDGELVVVNKELTKAVKVDSIAPNLQFAIENWDTISPKLIEVYNLLCQGKQPNAINVNQSDFHSPLPRAYQWLDGSAYIQHIVLVRKARNAEPPENLKTVPLMYQGGSDTFLSPKQDIPLINFSHGLDFEGEVGIITDFVPMGIKEKDAIKHIKLILLINDVSLRGLIPAELAMGFGFLQSKPSTAFSPFAVTPDELGEAWKNARVNLPLKSEYNKKWFGHPNAGEMFFSFGKLIEHAARTRDLHAGTIIGSGTVSNENATVGSSCIAEVRMLEQINNGKITTPFMSPGDTIKIWMEDNKGADIFGKIEQKVVQSTVVEN